MEAQDTQAFNNLIGSIQAYNHQRIKFYDYEIKGGCLGPNPPLFIIAHIHEFFIKDSW